MKRKANVVTLNIKSFFFSIFFSNLTAVFGLSDETLFDIVAEPANRGVGNSFDFRFWKVTRKRYRSGAPSLSVLEDNYVTLTFQFRFKQFSPFFETFNDLIGRIIASLVMKKWYDGLFPLNKKVEAIGPQVLTMEHLELGFIACLMMLGLATAVFLVKIFANGVNTKQMKLLQSSLHCFKHQSESNRNSKDLSQVSGLKFRNIRRNSQPLSLMKLDQSSSWMYHLY